MFHHVVLGTNDLVAGGVFYDTVLTPLGYVRTYDNVAEGWIAWQEPGQAPLGGVAPGFWLCRPANGHAACGANGGTVAFQAPTRASVDAFYAAALAGGGECAGPPGLRPDYGLNYYGAYVRDPIGNKLAAVCRRAP
jgi:catechol 2,3-dioxygenase-like lactoylglutathione lyase family enzyme